MWPGRETERLRVATACPKIKASNASQLIAAWGGAQGSLYSDLNPLTLALYRLKSGSGILND